MNTKKGMLVAGIVIVIGWAATALMVNRQPLGREEAKRKTQTKVFVELPTKAPMPSPDAPALPPHEESIALAESLPQTASAKSVGESRVREQTTAPVKAASKQKEPINDPLARAALSLVGLDSEAEQYWVAAINDPNLPANERKDLIEELNEDGLSDAHHPADEDLPLIVSRVRLIEKLAPSAMDQVNADAFEEAYKDLIGLLNGEPPQ